ncbi:MAG TPA: OstA-like protein, partial [Chitinophagaceae bacterium]|nr:OstA-like protein [Chitinophagaceae bacterium]
MRKFLQLFLLSVLILKADISFAQITPAPSGPDTLRTIRIIRGNVLRVKTVDSLTKIETIAGDVVIHEGTTKFTCDSAIINRRLNTMEAFGNVHINQGDSLFTSSQYIKYLGNERVAYLKRNVKLTDKRSTLTTQDLEYNLTTGIGKYNNGGKVVNGKTTLTSKEGVYYEDTKDIYFINNVDVVDPKTKIKADSLLYNTQTQKMNFIGPTYIKNKDGNIFTTQGTYDVKTGDAFFSNRSTVKDSSGRVYQANTMAFDEKTGEVQMEGTAIIRDSVSRFIVTGNQLFLNRKNNSFLATKKPVLVIWEKKDTTYISADTLFSGFTTKVYEDLLPPGKDSSIAVTVTNDSTSKTITDKRDTVAVPIKNDSTSKTFTDKRDTVAVTIKNDSTSKTITDKKDTTGLSVVNKTTVINSDGLQNKADTSIRYFLAYHHVKIFNDSLQAVSDSLFYSGADSTFRLFYDPVIWSGNSQITGDTIFLYTKNKKAEHVYVFENGIMINKINAQFYNQVAGKTINGYFKDGVIDYIRVKGSPAESIYFLQDKDSAFTGMNRADGSVIDMYFIKQELDKVKFLNDVHGKLYPMRQIPKDQRYLKKFVWLD